MSGDRPGIGHNGGPPLDEVVADRKALAAARQREMEARARIDIDDAILAGRDVVDARRRFRPGR